MKKEKSLFAKIKLNDLFGNITIPSVVVAVAFIAVVFIMTFSFSWSYEDYFRSYADTDYGTNFGTFCLNGEFEMVPYIFFPYILAVSQLSFLHSKKQCYTQFSYPVDRKTLFTNRVSIPFVIISGAVIVIKLFALAENIKYFGFSPELLGVWIVHLLRLFAVALLSYTLTVICCILCGKTIEAAFSSVSIFSIPVILATATRVLGSIYIYGGYDNEKFNNIVRFAEELFFGEEYSSSYFELIKESFVADHIINPHTIFSAFCLIASVICFVLIRKHFLKSYKPEICGFKGVNKGVNFFVCVAWAIIGGYVSLYFTDVGHSCSPGFTHHPIFYIYIFAAMLLCAFICGFLLNFSFKKAAKNLLSGVCAFGIVGLVVMVFATDFFGTYNIVPEKESVESIDISLPYAAAESDEIENDVFGSHYNNFYTFTEAEDIEKFLEFYRVLMDNRKCETALWFDFTIIYKDGTHEQKYFQYPAEETVEAMTKLWDTEAVRQREKELLFPEKYFINENNKKADLVYDESAVVFNSLYGKEERVALKKEDFDALREAVLTDLSNISPEEKARPTSKFYGNLTFILSLSDSVNYYDYEYSNSLPYRLTLNENMTETVRLLKELNLFDLLFTERSVSCAYMVELYELKDSINYHEYRYHPTNAYFNAGILRKDATDTVLGNKLIDENKIKELLKDSQRYYLTNNEKITALVVDYEDDEENYTVYLLPEHTE